MLLSAVSNTQTDNTKQEQIMIAECSRITLGIIGIIWVLLAPNLPLLYSYLYTCLGFVVDIFYVLTLCTRFSTWEGSGLAGKYQVYPYRTAAVAKW